MLFTCRFGQSGIVWRRWGALGFLLVFAMRTSAAQFTIDAGHEVKPISRWIYGANRTLAGAYADLTFTRVGGNRLTAYNWVNNASNAGSDWYFQNDDSMGGGDVPGGAVVPSLETAHAHHAGIILTIPIAGYVAADVARDGDVRRSRPNYLRTRFRVEMPRKGKPFTLSPDARDPVVYQDEFANWVRTKFPWGHTDPDSPIFFALDNEPDCWNGVHAEVHPKPVTYQEIIQRTTDYAAAIKDAYPEALIFAPVNYGWSGMQTLQGASDGLGRNFHEVYLAAMKEAEAKSGRRLLDVLDFHWYPEVRADGVRICEPVAGSSALVAARLQAPRSLWDPSYVEQSWITDSLGRKPICLIPSLRQKIATFYPGTKVAITEYNYGAGGHISGAIAEADVLGIFGREGVFAAAVWPMADQEPFIAAAFSMYRNFDSHGAKFGDTSVFAATDDVDATSVYASIDSTDPNVMVIVALNKTDQPIAAQVHLQHAMPFTRAQVYQLTPEHPAPQAKGELPMHDPGLLELTLPAMSVSTIRLSVAN